MTPVNSARTASSRRFLCAAVVALIALPVCAVAQCSCAGCRAQTFLAQLGDAPGPTMGRATSAEGAATIWDAPWGSASEMQTTPSRPNADWADAYPMQRPRVYKGANLEYVMMPIGGIGTGTIWLDGQGRLAVWQIFNNYDERRIPDSFFAVRAQVGDRAPIVRALQTAPRPGLAPMRALEYEGGYPIARLEFDDPDLPAQVTLEAFNPMIPTDAANSALPCAIFRITARNEGGAPAKVHVLGCLRNALADPERAGIAAPGGPLTQPMKQRSFTGVYMSQSAGPLAPGQVLARTADGREVPGPDMLWVDGLMAPNGSVEDKQEFESRVETLGRLMREGGAVLISGLTPEFFEGLQDVKRKERAAGLEVFEDFEGGSYEGWTPKGEAFADKPSSGTSPGQQRVSGFMGGGLVNTFVSSDGPQGELISRPFTIRKPWIGFLVGGGAHVAQTCINLRVGDEIARTATGKHNERLELRWWDVKDLIGAEARFEIIDHHSGGWGHINVDHIFFSNVNSDAVIQPDRALPLLAKALDWPPEQIAAAIAAPDIRLGLARAPDAGPWRIGRYTRVPREAVKRGGHEVLALTPSGDPVVLLGSLGKAGAVLCLASDLPHDWVQPLLEAARRKPLRPAERLVPASPAHGSLTLTSPDAGAAATAWTDGRRLIAQFAQDGAPGASPEGINGAVAIPLEVPPGEARTATFVITWHFPNIARLGGHRGNLYSRRFPDAKAVAEYVNANVLALWEQTDLYHRTLYQSNLPESWLDAMSSQSVIPRGPTVWWAEDGYFGGFEGCYQCCPLNCTHVWNYAQTHARLFPAIGRNMRQSDLLVYLHPDGETSHRQHGPHGAFIDGHAATIMGALREYQLSPDLAFLRQVWPNLRQATNWLIQRIDADRDGVPDGAQPNTYDCSVSGANTFIGSQYLAALAAAEKLALVMGDEESTSAWRTIREAGMKNQNEKLWNGEYYIQAPGEPPRHDYNTGCHSDQLLGQWWAHQTGLGYLFPPDRIHSALSAIMKHNFRSDFHGFKQKPRRYVLDDEAGLLMCTWPDGDRPDPFIIYADEAWTGIEYATAGAMIFEGMIDEATQLVNAARSRYDGRRRDGVNSGPGGNPFNELECGKFYARAMSSWGLLIAAQGLVLEGPAGVIGFKPKWQPADHRSFFTAPEGWGLFVQSRTDGVQSERIEVRHGRLRVRQLVFELPAHVGEAQATTLIDGEPVETAIQREGTEIRITLASPALLKEGSRIDVTLK